MEAKAERKSIPRSANRIYKCQELKENVAQFSMTEEEDGEELTVLLKVS